MSAFSLLKVSSFQLVSKLPLASARVQLEGNALQGYQQVMAMMQQAGGFMPFAYPGMTPPIMPPPVSTPSTFVPRMVPIHPVNLTGTLNEAAPSNVHEINEAEQEAARRKKGKAIAEPSKTRDSAFKRLGGKEDGPRKSAKLRLGPEMGRTSAMERLGGGRHAQSRRSRESETIHQDEEEAESQPRADLPRTGGDHNDPLVITMDINGADVARVLVDTGSSVNVLYLDAFKKLKLDRSMLRPLQTPLSGFTGASIEAEGQITLPVTLGSGNKTVTKQMRFVVVNIKCVHNAILGRPGINQEEEPARAITEPWWSMSVDGASGPKGYGGGVVFTTPEGFKVYHALIFNFKLTNNEAECEALIGGLRLAKTLQITCLRIKFDSSLVVGHINGNMEAKGEKMQKYRDLARALLKDLTEYVMEQIPRGKNTDADLLSKLTQAAPEHVSKLARIETLEKASIEGFSVSTIEEGGQPNPDRVEPDNIWIDDLVKYYMTGQFPEDEDRVRKVKLRAPRFQMLDGRLYKRAFGGPLLRCLTRAEAERVIAEVHQGVCAAHQMSRTLAQRIILLGYFWPTMNQDCEKYVQRCKTCQVFYKFPGRPATYYHPVSNVIPFVRFGMDIIGAFPHEQGRKKYVMVAIDYFTKWRLGEAGTNWLEELPHIIWAYRVTSRRATGETPFVLTYGCEARLPIEAKIMTFREKVYEEKGNEEDHLAELNLLEERRMVAEAKMIEYQQAAKAYHDNKVGPRYFQVGDEVLRRREASKPGDGGKLARKWEGPYRVTAILRPGTYKLETMEGRELERCWNSHHLRKFYR
ncbi:unnamed protein product [Cuscuta campestris]|uniref:RNase H type-1 domain-containing protein n=1 Tax=Cuscuta campestris TaxID=132261 RepID=A0A484LSZ0_9ASTE|nr:unnamed protein product [Cuscuta campestris]